jgi:hypothetical protein
MTPVIISGLLWPDEYKAGEAILPYSEVKH